MPAPSRESGKAIALTRGEFVRRAGWVLSRDFLLDAAVEPAQRSNRSFRSPKRARRRRSSRSEPRI